MLKSMNNNVVPLNLKWVFNSKKGLVFYKTFSLRKKKSYRLENDFFKNNLWNLKKKKNENA